MLTDQFSSFTANVVQSSGAGDPCHSYRSLLAELATQTRNTLRVPGAPATFDKLTQPTELQARALDLARTRAKQLAAADAGLVRPAHLLLEAAGNAS